MEAELLGVVIETGDGYETGVGLETEDCSDALERLLEQYKGHRVKLAISVEDLGEVKRPEPAFVGPPNPVNTVLINSFFRLASATGERLHSDFTGMQGTWKRAVEHNVDESD